VYEIQVNSPESCISRKVRAI